MGYTVTQILNAIAVAKCCIADYTCKLLGKATNGQEYAYTKLINIELSLIVFALETNSNLSTGECLTELQIEKLIHRINKLCQCNCVATTTTETELGVHTSVDHTELDHTE